MGYTYEMEAHRLAEQRSIALHRAVATKLAAEPRWLARARARVAAWRRDGSVAAYYVDAWEDLLALDMAALQAALVDEGERARALRQVSPFAGTLSARERWRIWRAVGKAAEEAEPGAEAPVGEAP